MTVNGESKTLSKDDVILIPSSSKYVTKVVFKTIPSHDFCCGNATIMCSVDFLTNIIMLKIPWQLNKAL